MINKVVLVGRLTKNPELQMTKSSNTAFSRFSIAVNRSYQTKEGNVSVDFINCIAWRGQAENLAKYMKKGSLIGVEGRIQVSSYTNDNNEKRTSVDVVADAITFLEKKGSSPGRSETDSEGYYPDAIDDDDDTENDLPF